MAEYIEREWLVKEAEAILNFRKQYYMNRNRIADAADTVEWLKYYAPAADVVKVVKCEKCQKFDPDEIAAPNTGTCWHHEMIKRFDDFCSCGERRSE